MNTSPFWKVLPLALAAIGAAGVSLHAADDEITAELDAAREAYNEGKINEAIQALDMARQLLMQKTAGDLAQLFPEFDGFTRGEPQSSAAGQSMFGGMVTAECEYTANRGDGTITAKYITKSPMLQSIMMMFSMPGMSGNNGMKVERIAGKRCLVQREGSGGKVQIVYESELLVEIDFQDVDFEKVKAFIGEIPWDELNELLVG
jgi:hypothetical protein